MMALRWWILALPAAIMRACQRAGHRMTGLKLTLGRSMDISKKLVEVANTSALIPGSVFGGSTEMNGGVSTPGVTWAPATSMNYYPLQVASL